MKYEKAFTYMFKDKDAVKKLIIGSIAAICSFIVFGLFFVLGYFIETVNRIITHRSPIMPDWEDVENIFKQGVMGFAITFVYAMVFLIVIILPIIFIAYMGSAIFAGGILYNFLLLLLFFLSIILTLPLMIAYPISLLLFAAEGDFKSAFDVFKIASFLRRNISTYVIIFLLGVFLVFLSPAGIVFIVIGMGFTMFYSMLVWAYFCGEMYLEDLSKRKNLKLEKE